MKRMLLGFASMLLVTVALAMPTPRQIEDALANKNYLDAKSMVQEVLREKPDSARAHLLNAYLLIHVDQNKTAANAELQTAAGLDKKGDVKSSPLFGRVVTEIDMAPATVRAAATGEVRALKPAPDYGRIAAGIAALAIIGLAVGLIIWLLFRRADPDHMHFTPYGGYGATGSMPSATPPSGPAAGGAFYPQAVAPVVVSPSNPTMGAFGTAASVAGGVVAGSMLSDALLHRHHSHGSSEDSYSERRRRESQESAAPAYSEPSPVSYRNERSSFSSGSDSSWGSSDSLPSSSSDSGSSWD